MIRKSKRFIGLSVMLAMTVGLISGCASKTDNTNANNNSPEPTKNEQKEKVNIQFFTWTTGSKDYIQPMVDKYNETNTDGVNVEVIWKSGDWQTALKTSIAAGQAPDLMYGTPDMNESINNNWIEPWDNYVSDEFKGRTKDISYNVSVGGTPQTYGYIWSVKTYRLAYNLDIFKECGITEVPKTWEEFYETAKLITEKGNGKYYGTAIPMQKGSFGFWTDPVLGYEGRYVNGVDFKTNKVDYSVLSPYVSLWRDLYQNKITIPGTESMDNDAVRAQFAAGKIGMLPSVSWDAAAINTQFQASCQWAVTDMLVPIGGQEAQLALRDQAYYNLSATSKYKKETAKFLEYLLGDEYLSNLYANCSDMVTIPSALKAAEGKQFPQAQWSSYAPKETEVKYSPVLFSSQLVGDNIQTVIPALIVDKSLDIDKTLQDVNKRMTEGIINQAKADAEKAKQSGSKIDKIGKIPTIEGYDPMKPVDTSKIKYVTAEEWEALQK
jgi:multiple sugar transport system substrate-binding protein